MKDVDKSDKKEKLVGVDTIDIIDKIDTEKETTERMPQKETLTTKVGKAISDDMIDFNKATVGFIKKLFDALFTGPDRDYVRFYALENIAP